MINYNYSDSVDPLASGFVQENEKLKCEVCYCNWLLYFMIIIINIFKIAILKKQLMLKDQLLLEKDKQVIRIIIIN